MTAEESLNRLLVRYEGKPLLRALVQLIPLGVGSAVETALLTRLHQINAERLRVFFDELATAEIPLSPDLINSDDFLHAYFRTVQAVTRTNRRQKIRYLARLLKSAAAGPTSPESSDEYEELLGIIDDLSLRELVVLSTLAKYERATPQGEENALQRSIRFWKAFVAEVMLTTGMSRELLDAWLLRLPRSGCYELFTGYASGPLGGQGSLTALYYRLESFAGDINEVQD